MRDLWPDDVAAETVTAPVTILAEQGEVLGSKTQNLVKGEVRRIAGTDMHSFSYRLLLVAPALGFYGYELMRISHGVDLYPVTIAADDDVLRELTGAGQEELVANTQDEFVEILAAIFRTRKTRQVIRALLAQSVHAPDPDDIPF